MRMYMSGLGRFFSVDPIVEMPKTILYYSRQLEMRLIDDTRMYKSVRLLANGDVTQENGEDKKRKELKLCKA